MFIQGLDHHILLAEGAIKIDDLVQLAIDNNMPALALTDNGNLFGALEFSIKAAKNGIQPLLGNELASNKR